MKYFPRTVIGLGLEVGGIVAISYTIYKLLQVGTDISALSPPWQYVVPYGSDEVQTGGPRPTRLAGNG